MTESIKIMCLEDMCPEQIQKYLSSKHLVEKLQTYSDYKLAIDEFFYEEKRWGGKRAPKANMINEHFNALPILASLGITLPSEPEEPEKPEDHGKAPGDDEWIASLYGEINALVKGKMKAKGKGKGKGALGKGSKDEDTVMKDRSTLSCHECGENVAFRSRLPCANSSSGGRRAGQAG